MLVRLSTERRMPYRLSVRGVPSAVIASLLVSSAMPAALCAQLAGGAPKQDNLPVTDEVRQQRMMHVSPNRIIFDGSSNSATVVFSNISDKPVQAVVQMMFANMDYPHDKVSDATLFTPHWEKVFPRDTVVANPKPTDPYAGRWITGLPTEVTLGPKQKKSVTIRIAPPANVPNGEYWARVVAVVRPPAPDRNKGKPKDERTIYSLPVKGQPPPELRDSVEIFYRKGPMQMGIRMGPGAIAQIDTADLPGPPDVGAGNGRLWFRVPLELTGNMHFDGVMHVTYRNVGTGAIAALTPAPMILYRSAVTHWWGQADQFGSGNYELIITFDAPQDDVPAAQRIPVTPTTVKIPFVIRR